MACNLLHIVEQPDPDAYADPALKDLVGQFPSFYCARCTPVRHLLAGDVVQCLRREGPCRQSAETPSDP